LAISERLSQGHLIFLSQYICNINHT